MTNNRNYVLVLSDGETFSPVKGCEIFTLTDTGLDRLDEGATFDELLHDGDVTDRFRVRTREEIAEIISEVSERIASKL